MSIQEELETRSGAACELCKAQKDLTLYEVPGAPNKNAANSAFICATCISQIKDSAEMDANHWRCLNDSMWSEVPAVQVIAWRMLNRLRGEGWPQDLLDMLYLDEKTLAWAQKEDSHAAEELIPHKDSNGVVLEAGDTVVLIKDLKVKGANFTAKRGTAVRRIALVADHPEHIEGRVNDQRIVILTQYVKKSN